MSEPTVSPRGLQEAVEKLQETLRGAAEQIGMEMGDEVAWNTSRALYVLGNSLYAVIRAAQLSALESVAKEMCDWCAREKHMPPPTKEPTWNGWWHYQPGQISRRCEAPEAIHDALARLRSEAGSGSASAPRKEA